MAINLNNNYEPEDRWQAVVDHGEGWLVVNAGPGTGKTFSLLRKLDALLKSGTAPSRIYYLTFANSIVDAFCADVEAPEEEGGLGLDPRDTGINVSTLHSLAFKTIATHARRLGLSEHLEMVTLSTRPKDYVSELVVGDLLSLRRLQGKIGKREFGRQVDRLRKTWEQEDPVPDDLEGLMDLVRLLEDRYEILPWGRVMRIANDAIDEFGLPRWLRDAQHFLIDEFQDFNPAEQRHIDLIVEPSDSVVVVGDMDQSIYSGRSASPKGLRNLLGRDQVATVNFVLCRRCPSRVVEGANRILAMIDPDDYASRALAPYRDEQGVLEVVTFKSCKEEVDVLAAQIQSWGEEGLILLFPTWPVLLQYQRELEGRGIRCHTSGSVAGGEDLEPLLKLAVTGKQPALERTLLARYGSLNRWYVRTVLPTLDSLGSFDDALTAGIHSGELPRNVHAEYDEFKSTLEDLVSGVPERVHSALQRSDYELTLDAVRELLDESSGTPERERVTSALGSYVGGGGAEQGGVQLSTMHSAKGLSRARVVMPGLEDKWMPGTADGERLKEYHRLFYVALTRATDTVIISWPRTRARGDRLNYTPDGTGRGLSRYGTRLLRSD